MRKLLTVLFVRKTNVRCNTVLLIGNREGIINKVVRVDFRLWSMHNFEMCQKLSRIKYAHNILDIIRLLVYHGCFASLMSVFEVWGGSAFVTMIFVE